VVGEQRGHGDLTPQMGMPGPARAEDDGAQAIAAQSRGEIH
jgi:hypothetical protein